MELEGRTVALYGRFSSGSREELVRQIEALGGRVLRDFTLGSDVLVVGDRADSLIESGALPARLEAAAKAGKTVMSEVQFRRTLQPSAAAEAATLPLATALANAGASSDEARLLAALGLVLIVGDACRFADVAMLKTAAGLRESGCSATRVVEILREARKAPRGRHRVVVDEHGAPALEWGDGLTTLNGQGLLPLELPSGAIDDLFEAAVLADAEGRSDEAVRLFDLCARTDKRDAIALYNLGNIRLSQENWSEAQLAYRRALSRDRGLIEARYNLAIALEHAGDALAAIAACEEVLKTVPDHADAVFNLAQLQLKQDQHAQARQLFERYLELNPPAEWAAKARKAITYCASHEPQP